MRIRKLDGVIKSWGEKNAKEIIDKKRYSDEIDLVYLTGFTWETFSWDLVQESFNRVYKK